MSPFEKPLTDFSFARWGVEAFLLDFATGKLPGLAAAAGTSLAGGRRLQEPSGTEYIPGYAPDSWYQAAYPEAPGRLLAGDGAGPAPPPTPAAAAATTLPSGFIETQTGYGDSDHPIVAMIAFGIFLRGIAYLLLTYSARDQQIKERVSSIMHKKGLLPFPTYFGIVIESSNMGNASYQKPYQPLGSAYQPPQSVQKQPSHHHSNPGAPQGTYHNSAPAPAPQSGYIQQQQGAQQQPMTSRPLQQQVLAREYSQGPPSTGSAGTKTLKTSNVAKYQVRSQVNDMADPSLNGWYVIASQPDSGTSGPGVVTFSQSKSQAQLDTASPW
jgi:hypothetical protein